MSTFPYQKAALASSLNNGKQDIAKCDSSERLGGHCLLLSLGGMSPFLWNTPSFFPSVLTHCPQHRATSRSLLGCFIYGLEPPAPSCLFMMHLPTARPTSFLRTRLGPYACLPHSVVLPSRRSEGPRGGTAVRQRRGQSEGGGRPSAAAQPLGCPHCHPLCCGLRFMKRLSLPSS